MDTVSLLRRERRRAKLSQREVAERMGVPQPRISEWERGVYVPSAAVLERWAAALGCEWVLKGGK